MSTLQELQTLIQQKFGIDPATIDPDAPMREKGFDSLALVEFVFAIEDRFGISMSDEDSDIDTLNALVAAVDRIRAKQAA